MFMKLKKLLAAVTAAALAVTTMAVTSFTASATSLSEAPVGTETVLYSVDLSSVKSTFTSSWDSGDWTQIIIDDDDRATIMTDPEVYIKATMSNMGSVTTKDGDVDFGTLMTWGFGGYNWMTGLKWYNNNDDGADFECNLLPLETSTANRAIAYAPISDVKMYDWGGIAGNLQCGHFSGLTLNKLEIVRVSAVVDTTVYADQVLPLPAFEGSTLKFDGTFDKTKINGLGAYIEIKWTANDASSGMKLMKAEDYDTVIGQKNGNGSVGAQTTTFKLDETFISKMTDKMWVNGWGAASIESVTIHNDATKGDVYTVGSSTPDPTTPTLTISPTTLTVAEGATGTITMTAANADGYTFSAASSAEDKATVTLAEDNSKITVTGVAEGSATITVTGTNGSDMITATCNVTVTAAGDSGGDEGDDTPTTTTLWTGNTDMGTDWSANVHIPAEKFANIKAGDTLKFTFTKGSADYFQLKFASASQGWPVLSSPVKNEYNSVDLTDSPYSFVVNAADAAALKADGMGINGYGVILTKVELISAGGSEDPKPPVVDPPVNPPVDPDTPSTPDTPVTPPVVSGNSVTMGSTEFNGWFEAVLTKDQLFGSNTGATTITFTGADLAKVGYNSISAGGYKGIDCTGTVTIQINDIDLSDNFFLHVGGNAATAVTWSFNGGSSGGNEPSNPTDPSNPSAPSYGSTYEPPIPSGATSISMVDTIISTGAASVSFNLGSSAKLDKEVFEALASKGDITVRFNVAGGAYWEIGGANITAAKAVDLGVRMNSTLIPASAVSELAGDKTTIQLSLKHNGDFGFTGVLNVPVGKANNGKFANLYYYHSGKFDFVGSSAISNGRAKFAFSHASNYLIVIDDYAYGEDVSSAAGMTETTETSAVPYVAALVVVSAFAASAVVLKKRLSK